MKKTSGFTLVEMMIVVTILGIIASIGPDLFLQMRRFFFMSSSRIDLQREASSAMSFMNRNLRQAEASSIVLDRGSGQPYYSRITFSKIDGSSIVFYQDNKSLITTVNGASKSLSSNLRYITFTFPKSDEMDIVSISLTLEKASYEGRTKALHMASEKVRVMND